MTMRIDARIPELFRYDDLRRIRKLTERSRSRLLDAIGDAADITFVRGMGNWGDELIFAGARQLLRGFSYRELGLQEASQAGTGELAVVAGGGGWCNSAFHMPAFVAGIEARFQRVIILPSSYQPAITVIADYLSQSQATFFSRERPSLRLIQNIRPASALALDCAFYFDFSPYRRHGEGTLVAFRTDVEATGAPVPEGNRDISLVASSLDDWLWTIARHEIIRTDRAHVMIAGVMLGKRVFYAPSNYHKVDGLADWFRGIDRLSRLPDGSG